MKHSWAVGNLARRSIHHQYGDHGFPSGLIDLLFE